MGDLYLGFALLAGGAGVLFGLGARLGRTLPEGGVKGLAVATLAALAGYVVFLADNVVLAGVLPVSALIVVGNWIPLGLSLLAGLAWALIPRQAAGVVGGAGGKGVRARRVAVVAVLQAVGVFAVVRPIWGRAPSCGERWDGDFCIQTTESTCSAACAATLLKAHGIEATEREMADLCLTRKGTLWQGLYRGLKRKTAGTDWDVEVVHGPFARLATLGKGPAILAAGIPRNAEVAGIYTERYGWTPGEWHSVLFFGFRGNGLVAMGDPSPGVGRENWTEEDLRVLWGGRGMRLVSRVH
jgi:hypothetical protein